MGRFLGTATFNVSPYADRDRVLQRYVNSRPPENRDAEANIRWGGKSTFNFVAGGGFVTAPEVIVNWPPRPEDEDPENTEEIFVDLVEKEGMREVEEVRVENPDDPDQYVMVEDATRTVFEGPDLRPIDMVGPEGRQQKIYYRFTFLPRETE